MLQVANADSKVRWMWQLVTAQALYRVFKDRFGPDRSGMRRPETDSGQYQMQGPDMGIIEEVSRAAAGSQGATATELTTLTSTALNDESTESVPATKLSCSRRAC